jgi:hypothetical protein
MSAVPPKADIYQHDRHVCFVPIADNTRGDWQLIDINAASIELHRNYFYEDVGSHQ